MDNLVIATSEADASAADAVEQHHAQLAGTLALRVEALVAAAAGGDADTATRAKADLVTWCEQDLVPHALAEKSTIYPAAQVKTEGRLLVEAMLTELDVITGLVADLAAASDPTRAAAKATALQVVFESHLSKENEQVLPLLVTASDVSVADLVGGQHELVGGAAAPDATEQPQAGHGGHNCACGEVDPAGYPELDARVVPHAIRHATIFGALDSVQPGGGMILVAPHDPLPLLSQIEQRAPGTFEVDYLERGPEAWRLAFVRRSA